MNFEFDERPEIKHAGPALKWVCWIVCGCWLPALSVHAQTNLVVNGGFETGDLTGWTSEGADVDTDSDDVYAGNYGAYFVGGVGSLVYIFQNVPTIPGRSYLISAWVKGTLNRPFPRINEFHVTWDGTNVFDATNNAFAQTYWDLDWTNVQLVAVASSQHTLLQFGFQDDNAQGGFLGLDEVSVELIPPPEVVPGEMTVTNGNLALTWNSLPGLTYQPQYTTRLPAGSWIDLGPPLKATGLSTTSLDPMGSDSQRFYRVVMLP